MANVKRTNRDKALWNRYIDVLRRYGKAATALSKEFIYAEVGEPLFLNHRTVGLHIRRMMKDPAYRESFQIDDDMRYILKELDKMGKK